jgi:pilus assembly protein Flp/PilA
MPVIVKLTWKLRIWRDTRGQELVEYALIAGFIACACGATLPDIGSSVLTVFSKVLGVLNPITDNSGASPTS